MRCLPVVRSRNPPPGFADRYASRFYSRGFTYDGAETGRRSAGRSRAAPGRVRDPPLADDVTAAGSERTRVRRKCHAAGVGAGILFWATAFVVAAAAAPHRYPHQRHPDRDRLLHLFLPLPFEPADRRPPRLLLRATQAPSPTMALMPSLAAASSGCLCEARLVPILVGAKAPRSCGSAMASITSICSSRSDARISPPGWPATAAPLVSSARAGDPTTLLVKSIKVDIAPAYSR